MTPGRILAVAGVLLAAIAASVLIYYNTVQTPFWTTERTIKAQAVEAAALTSVTAITKHVWDKQTWVVEGQNEAGEDLFVFINPPEEEQADAEALVAEGTEQVVKASESARKADIKARFLQANPDAVVKRIMPGMLDGQLVWEVFYMLDENVNKYFYEFYTFREGTLLTTYRLPASSAG